MPITEEVLRKLAWLPVQHTETGDCYAILVNGFNIGMAYPDTGSAYIDEDALRESVDKALQKRFGKRIQSLELA